MSKGVDWLKNEVNKLPLRFLGFSMLKQREEFTVSKDDVLELINQLDEPEVLSQEWIDENKEMYLINDTSENAVPDYKLQNLLVPKQDERTQLEIAYKDILSRREFLFDDKRYVIVEEEQKYQVIIRDGEYMRLYLCKYDGNVTIGTNDNYIEKCPEVTYLTEREIKDYDKRYWPFAVKVEELEE